MAGPTNTERIEANTAAIRSAERTLAVHEKQLTLLERDVNDVTDRFTNMREAVGRIDERLKHVERSVDRIGKLLLTLVAAAVIEVVRRRVLSL